MRALRRRYSCASGPQTCLNRTSGESRPKESTSHPQKAAPTTHPSEAETEEPTFSPQAKEEENGTEAASLPDTAAWATAWATPAASAWTEAGCAAEHAPLETGEAKSGQGARRSILATPTIGPGTSGNSSTVVEYHSLVTFNRTHDRQFYIY